MRNSYGKRKIFCKSHRTFCKDRELDRYISFRLFGSDTQIISFSLVCFLRQHDDP